MSEILTRLHLGIRPFVHEHTAIAKKDLCSEASPCIFLASFTAWFQTGGPGGGNLSSQILKLRQPWTAAAPRPRCIRKLSEKGRHAVCQSFSYIRVHHGLHLHLIKPPELALSYKPWLLFQTQLADNQVVIRRQLCTPFDTNVQQWLKQVSENDTEINEWLLTQRISVPDVLVYFCVGRKYSSEMSGLSHFCDPDPVLIF